MLSSFSYFMMVFLGIFNIYYPILFVFCWLIQGITQSTVWPGCIALLGKWFDKHNRGKIMGFFSLSSSVGNFSSANISGKIISSGGSWITVILLFSVFQLVVATLFFIFVKDTPEEKFNIEMQHKDILMMPIGQPRQTIIIEESRHKKGIPFMQALRIPNIINFALAFACAKFLAYGLIMWIPFYLHNILPGNKWIGLMASLLDLGAILGGISCGWLGDKFETRPPFISLYLIFTIPCFFIISSIGIDLFWALFLFLPITGFFIGGVVLILSSAVPADLAQNKNIENLYEAMATVAGIIDGCGGLGAAIGTFIVGYLADKGWKYVFSFMISMAIFAFLLILKISYREIQQLYAKRYQENQI